MTRFFRVIRNILILALIAFGIMFYNHNPQIVQNALTTANYHIQQLVRTNAKIDLSSDSTQSKTVTSKSNTDSSSTHYTWSKPEAKVYVDISNNAQLHSATIDAMNIWNRTGAFTFHQVSDKKDAQIIINIVNDSDTEAAGETLTTYNPATKHLLKATIHLNRYYLQNSWYGYNYSRIVNTAEHELGHAMGLNHTNSVSIMYPKGSTYTIQPQDIANLKKIYNEK